jgi:hypothetical protein
MQNLDARFDTGEAKAPIETGGTAMVVQLATAELNQAVTTAKAYPRSIQRAMTNILSLATLDSETAQECVYALPRGGKPITGPSVRLAEIIASQWGNCQIGSRVVAVDRMEKVVIAEGVFHDLETGMKRVAQVQRRISDRNGKLFNDDMIAVTGNAAASVALREAVLKGVPKAIWRKAYEAAEHVIKGDVKTLVVRRDEAIKAFAAWGITPDQIFSCLEVQGLDDIGLEEIGTLTTIYRDIRAKEATVEEYFPAVTGAAKAAEAARGTARRATAETKPKPAEVKDEAKEAQKEADHSDAEINRADDAARQAMQDKRDAAARAKQEEAKQEVKADLFDAQDVAEAEDAVEVTEETDAPPAEDEDAIRSGSTVKQFLADIDAMGGMENAMDLWSGDLDRWRDEKPVLHSILMEEGTKMDIEVKARG